MLRRNLRLRSKLIGPGIKDGDLSGKVFSLENNCRGEVCEGATGRNFPLRLHRLSVFPEQRLIALAPDQAKAFIITGLLKDDLRELFLGRTQLLSGH